jgi:ParB family chromosome partitioning protein
MPLASNNPLDFDEALLWLRDRNAPLLRKMSAAAWLCAEGLGSAAIARQVNHSASTIRHWARLSARLSPAVLERLERSVRMLSMGHLKALAALSHSAQLPLLERCIAHRYSVRKLEALARQSGEFADRDEATYYAQLSEQMSLKLGFPVTVRPERQRGAGKVVVQFHTLDEFDALCNRLNIDLSEI